MQWIERGIAVLSPRWAAERQFYRLQLDLSRKYDAAQHGRRQGGWSRPSTSANAEIASGGQATRNSARDLVRNVPWAKKAKRTYVANMVGTGIVPRAKTGNARRDAKIDAAFEAWCQECDAAGQLDFYGLQSLVAGTMYESGEVLVRYRDRPLRDARVVPVELQVLEPDFLDTSRFGRPEAASGTNVINQGIEFDDKGRRVAYYLWAEHPGDVAGFLTSRLLKSSRVPADQVAHVYRVDRPGQIRGITEFAPVIQLANDLHEYADAHLVLKKVAACFGMIVKRNGGATKSPLTGAKASTDAQGRRIETMSPGMVGYLDLDEDVAFPRPPTSEDYADYTAAQLHAFAIGAGVTYETLTGDLSKVNYSSYRAGQLDFRRAIEMDQWLMLVPMFCAPTWRRFIDRLVLLGTLDRPYYGVDWATPRFESVDPQKDAEADKTEVRSGFQSLKAVIARRGYNPDQVLREIAETYKLLDQLGLKLDTDPRNGDGKGGAAPAAADSAKEEADEQDGSSSGD